MSKTEGLSRDQHTIREHRIKTSDGLHKLYVQQWGNPKGTPILFLHGGPGGGCDDGHKRFFDPKKHLVIFFDQRGAGKSTPYGSLENNETSFLVEDIELIRSKLGINSWHIEGASWGSTLALCYGIKYSSSIKSIVIAGIFLGTKAEAEWITSGLFQSFFPEVWEANQKIIPKNRTFSYRNKQDLAAYSNLIYPILGLDDRSATISDAKESLEDLVPTKLELYYINNDCFIPDNYILKNVKKLTMPISIVQGRYDMICPPKTAYALSKALPDCSFYTTITGHRPSDRETFTLLKALLAQLK